MSAKERSGLMSESVTDSDIDETEPGPTADGGDGPGVAMLV